MNEDGGTPTLEEIRDKVEQVIAATDAAVGDIERPVSGKGVIRVSVVLANNLIPEVRQLGSDISALYDSPWGYQKPRWKSKAWKLKVKHIRERARALGIIE